MVGLCEKQQPNRKHPTPKTQYPTTNQPTNQPLGEKVFQVLAFHLFSNEISLVFYNLRKYQNHLQIIENFREPLQTT